MYHNPTTSIHDPGCCVSYGLLTDYISLSNHLKMKTKAIDLMHPERVVGRRRGRPKMISFDTLSDQDVEVLRKPDFGTSSTQFYT